MNMNNTALRSVFHASLFHTFLSDRHSPQSGAGWLIGLRCGSSRPATETLGSPNPKGTYAWSWRPWLVLGLREMYRRPRSATDLLVFLSRVDVVLHLYVKDLLSGSWIPTRAGWQAPSRGISPFHMKRAQDHSPAFLASLSAPTWATPPALCWRIRRHWANGETHSWHCLVNGCHCSLLSRISSPRSICHCHQTVERVI